MTTENIDVTETKDGKKVFYVDVGDMPIDEATAFVKVAQNKFKDNK